MIIMHDFVGNRKVISNGKRMLRDSIIRSRIPDWDIAKFKGSVVVGGFFKTLNSMHVYNKIRKPSMTVYKRQQVFGLKTCRLYLYKVLVNHTYPKTLIKGSFDVSLTFNQSILIK